MYYNISFIRRGKIEMEKKKKGRIRFLLNDYKKTKRLIETLHRSNVVIIVIINVQAIE